MRLLHRRNHVGKMYKRMSNKKHKRGDINDKGMIFYRYVKDYEYWVTPLAFNHLNNKQKTYQLKFKAREKQN